MSPVLQCRVCGRIRTGGPGSDWVRDDSVKVDVVGFCATCADRAHRKHIRDEKAWMRRLGGLREPPREMTDEDWDAFK